jgi:hypothetical protein
MGKGSARRNEDTQKVWDNWDLIFGKKDKESTEEKTEKEPEKDESTKNK